MNKLKQIKMKKLTLLLLFTSFLGFSQAEFPEGINLNGNATSVTATKVNVQEASGIVNTMSPIDLPISISPSTINYTPVGATIKGQLQGIDNALGSKAIDANVVHKTGDESVMGVKGFVSAITAPTATVGTNTTQVATTAFVLANSTNIPHLKFNNTNKTVWNNGKFDQPGSTSFGELALSNNISLSNTAMGFEALRYNTSGTSNVAVGSSCLRNNTSGQNNMGIGNYALYNNTTGSQNTVVGAESMEANTSGTGNASLGFRTLESNSTGSYNVAIGNEALNINSIGNNNTGIGAYSLRENTTGFYNAGLGSFSMRYNSSGSYNVGVGYSSLEDLTTGTANTCLGYNVGKGITTGSGNSILGASVTGLASNLTNNIILANGTGAIKAQHDGTNWTFTGGIIKSGATTTDALLAGGGTLANPVGGTGTSGYIPKFTAGGVVGNSIMSESANVITFNGANPLSMDVSLGRVYSNEFGSSTGSNVTMSTYTTGVAYIKFETALSERMRINNMGNVLIGTTVNSGDRLNVNGSVLSTKYNVTTGANASANVVTLVGGTATINTTAATPNSLIFLTRKTSGGTIGFESYSTTTGSFTITSVSALDTSTFSYLIIN